MGNKIFAERISELRRLKGWTLEELVDSKGLNFGMDIVKYKLDVE